MCTFLQSEATVAVAEGVGQGISTLDLSITSKISTRETV